MLLTITTTHRPATDLGYLLHKNPGKLHSVNLSFGQAHVFYPEASEDRCTAALLLEIDPVGLTRPKTESAMPLEPYVNDRPYAATSFLSVALTRVFSTAAGGRSKDRPELAGQAIPLEIGIPCLPSRGGEALLRDLFEGLGYEVTANPVELDEQRPDWGPSEYFEVTLRANKILKDVLAHLSVLIPVLDDTKHYWVGDDEIDKLLKRGEGWLSTHPRHKDIMRRYLKHQRSLVKSAERKLFTDDEIEASPEQRAQGFEEAFEKKTNLNETRLMTVATLMKELGASSVLDIGCGEGRLIELLRKDQTIRRILGADVSVSEISRAARRLELDPATFKDGDRLELIQSSLVYQDKRTQGFDAAAVIEVIEHMELSRLPTFAKVLFGFAKPKAVVLSTPNVEYNAIFGDTRSGFRHRDHRFEWTRAEFREWCESIRENFGYEYEIRFIGDEYKEFGAPTQMAVFKS